MSDANEEFWMLAVLSAWHKRQTMRYAYRSFCTFLTVTDPEVNVGEVMYSMRDRIPYFTAKMDTTAWLAHWYEPVSEALWSGQSDERALRLWRATTPTKKGSKSARDSTNRAKLKRYHSRAYQGSILAKWAYGDHWLSKAKWDVVK